MRTIDLVLFVIFLILQALDAFTTYRILAAGGRELNPVLAWAFARVGELPTLTLVKCLLLGCAVALLVTGWQYSACVLGVLCVVYVVVVISNFKQF